MGSRWCWIFSSVVLTLISLSGSVQADSTKDKKRAATLSGEINFEETTRDDRNYKDVAREAATSWIDSLVVSAGSVPPKPVPAMSRDVAFYLSALYLYCLHKQGVCPAVLEAVLESDMMSSMQAGTPGCPNSLAFWQQWLQQDMENRAKYLLSIGTATKVTIFNKRERSKYILCKNTVESFLKLPADERSAHYGASGAAIASIKRVQGLLHDINVAGVDVFQVVGLQVRGE